MVIACENQNNSEFNYCNSESDFNDRDKAIHLLPLDSPNKHESINHFPVKENWKSHKTPTYLSTRKISTSVCKENL